MSAKTVNRSDWTLAATAHNRAASKRLPRRVIDTLPMPAGSAYAFTEISGTSQPLVLMTAKLPMSMTRKIKVTLPDDFRAALVEATLGVNPLAAIVALSDYALDRLEGGNAVELTIKPIFDDTGRWLDCAFTSKRADTLTVLMPQRMSRGSQRHGMPDARTQAPFPDDVVARIERVMGQGERFSSTVLGLAWWTITDLRKRKKRLVISRAV